MNVKGSGAGGGRPFALVLVSCLARTVLLSREANRQCRGAKDAFYRAVAPVIEAAADDSAAAEALSRQLLPWAVKGTVLLERYAKLTGSSPDSRLAVLAGSFTRIYDDLLDETGSDNVAVRVGVLFSGGSLAARTDLERVLTGVFAELRKLADRPRHDAAYVALDRLHEQQLRSLHQADGDLTVPQTWEISLAKGGLGTLVLGCLIRPEVSTPERSALYCLGGLLQLIDDWEDEATDRSHGLQTTATTGGLSFRDIRRHARLVEAQLRALYGAKTTARFMDGIYCWICMTWVARRLGLTQPARRRARAFPRRFPLRVLIQHEEVLR